MSDGAPTTVDDFLSGRVQVVQPAKGFRAGTDSVLLAAALNAGARGEALEIGCGAGGALLPAAWRVQGMQFTGLERDLPTAALAIEGAAINNLEDRVTIVEGDAGTLPDEWENRFDLVFSNPPFFETGKIVDPGQGKQDAYIETVALKDWLSAMLFAVRPKGTLVMIHRAAELARILTTLEKRAGEITVMPIRSFPGEDAKRVLVRARKGLRPGALRLLAGIDIYESRGGERTDLLKAIAGDGAGLVW